MPVLSEAADQAKNGVLSFVRLAFAGVVNPGAVGWTVSTVKVFAPDQARVEQLFARQLGRYQHPPHESLRHR
jgi:hypothetical protein